LEHRVIPCFIFLQNPHILNPISVFLQVLELSFEANPSNSPFLAALSKFLVLMVRQGLTVGLAYFRFFFSFFFFLFFFLLNFGFSRLAKVTESGSTYIACPSFAFKTHELSSLCYMQDAKSYLQGGK